MSANTVSTPARDENRSVTVQQAEMGVSLEKRRLICKIQNFDKLRHTNQLVDAQKFQFEAGDSIGLPTTWSFFLGADEIRDSSPREKIVGGYLQLEKKPEKVKNVFASFDLFIRKVNGDVFVAGEVACKNMAEIKDGWGFVLLNQHADLTGLVQEDGSLVIEIDFSLLSQMTPVCLDIPGKVKAFEVKSLEKLSKDLGQLRVFKDANSDAVTKIVSKDNREFPVNRGILSCRSSVFQGMFQQKMKESISGVVNIDDLSGKTVDVLLHYLYTGTLHRDWKSPEVIEELTSAAHRYDLGILTTFLDDVLGSVATKENAMRLAIAARTLGMETAERELFNFVKQNATKLEDLTLSLEAPNFSGWWWNKKGNGAILLFAGFFAIVLMLLSPEKRVWILKEIVHFVISVIV